MNLVCFFKGHCEKKKFKSVYTKKFTSGIYTKSRTKPFKVMLVEVSCERCGKFLRNE